MELAGHRMRRRSANERAVSGKQARRGPLGRIRRSFIESVKAHFDAVLKGLYPDDAA
jgi:hypothetical protein